MSQVNGLPGPEPRTPAEQHNHAALATGGPACAPPTPGGPPAADRAGQEGRRSPSGASPTPAPSPPRCVTRKPQGRAEGGAGQSGASRRGPRRPASAPSRAPLKPENPHSPGHGAVGSREGRSGTRAAAALSPGVLGAARPTGREFCPTSTLGALGELATRRLLGRQGGAGGGAHWAENPGPEAQRAPGRGRVRRGGAGPRVGGAGRGRHAAPPPGESSLGQSGKEATRLPPRQVTAGTRKSAKNRFAAPLSLTCPALHRTPGEGIFPSPLQLSVPS